ncbi:autotransporter domain-containing protein [Desulfobacter vibrioformis]|uniref:autotransporter domain-containing protein n=1 Tax=Desulfobacter vibrioformis TaxID=34031 RepID=UPI000557D9EE|nr:autotransporter domain-containing protein [Desulfobacter vibrioformis]
MHLQILIGREDSATGLTIWICSLRPSPDGRRFPGAGGGPNIAFGGALSGLGYVPGLDVPNASQQVVEFQASYGQAYAPEDLVLFSMGQNDLHSHEGSPADPSTVAGNMVQAVELAYQNGARRFVFPTLFPVGLMPEVVNGSAVTPDEAAAWADLVNAEANTRFAAFQAAHPDAVIIRPDLTSRIREVYANPEKYGLTNVTDSAYTGDYYGTADPVASCPDAYLWWDGVHVTTTVHKLVAKWTLLDIQNEFFPEQSSPQAGLGSILTLVDQTRLANQWESDRVALLMDSNRTARSRERTGDWRFEPYGIAGRQDSSRISSGWSWHHAGFSMGREMPLAQFGAAGFSLGWSRGKLDLNNGYGEADTRLYQAGIYGGITKEPFYISGGSRYGYADTQAFRDMDLTDTTASHPFHTHLLSGWMETGFNLGKRSVIFSPLAGLSYVRAINGTGGESGGRLLDYDSIEYPSTHYLHHKLGGRVRGTIPSDKGPRGRWSAEAAWLHEYLDTQCESNVSHGGASYAFASPSRTRDSLGLSAEFSWFYGEKGSLALAYHGQWSKEALAHALRVSARWNY